MQSEYIPTAGAGTFHSSPGSWTWMNRTLSQRNTA